MSPRFLACVPDVVFYESPAASRRRCRLRSQLITASTELPRSKRNINKHETAPGESVWSSA